MAVILGKRKRRKQLEEEEPTLEDQRSQDNAAMRALFRQAFETKFNPIETPLEVPDSSLANIDGPDDSDGRLSSPSDWDGLSDDDDEVEIIYHEHQHALSSADAPRAKRIFMSSAPPKPEAADTKKKQKSTDAETPEEESHEVANLKNDLALQRLLKESKLLDSGSWHSPGGSESLQGKGRLKAVDQRLADLGARRPASRPDRMPLAHRRGIEAKARLREAKRRKEAAESGTVLERATSTAKAGRKRDRGIPGAAFGSFKGGTLKLSARDVRTIEGRKPGASRRGRGR